MVVISHKQAAMPWTTKQKSLKELKEHLHEASLISRDCNELS